MLYLWIFWDEVYRFQQTVKGAHGTQKLRTLDCNYMSRDLEQKLWRKDFLRLLGLLFFNPSTYTWLCTTLMDFLDTEEELWVTAALRTGIIWLKAMAGRKQEYNASCSLLFYPPTLVDGCLLLKMHTWAKQSSSVLEFLFSQFLFTQSTFAWFILTNLYISLIFVQIEFPFNDFKFKKKFLMS